MPQRIKINLLFIDAFYLLFLIILCGVLMKFSWFITTVQSLVLNNHLMSLFSDSLWLIIGIDMEHSIFYCWIIVSVFYLCFLIKECVTNKLFEYHAN